MRPFFKKEDIFKFNPNIPEVHAPTITETNNGDLLAAWFGGSKEGASDVAIYSSRFNLDDEKWSDPKILADIPKRSDQNPVLFTHGDTIWLFFSSLEGGGSTSIIMYKKSLDDGFTWSEEKIFRKRMGLWVRNRPIILNNGDFLLPIYDRRAMPNCCYVMISEDDGETWETYGPITSITGCAQGNVVQLSDGTLMMYMRTRSHPLHQFLHGPQRLTKIEISPGQFIIKRESPSIGGFIWESRSNDNGRTWNQSSETTIPNPNSGISLIKLRDGNLVLAFNDTHVGRSPLNVALSTDEGKTWMYKKVLENGEGEFSYPQLIQSSDGLIHVVYTYRRLTIRHAVFNEEWLKEKEQSLAD
ncbi:MAG: sialidase family protein [Candidatus Bathyarchaeia archaeon]|nr:exo-alpha-sialidase [Candidatus Bathyarchaeota archaeon]